MDKFLHPQVGFYIDPIGNLMQLLIHMFHIHFQIRDLSVSHSMGLAAPGHIGHWLSHIRTAPLYAFIAFWYRGSVRL